MNNNRVNINLENNSGIISISSYIISNNLFDNNSDNNYSNNSSNNSNNVENNLENNNDNNSVGPGAQNLPLDINYFLQYYNYYNYNSAILNTGSSTNSTNTRSSTNYTNTRSSTNTIYAQTRTYNISSLYDSYPYQNFMLDGNLQSELEIILPSLNDIINSYIYNNYNKLNEEEFNKYTEVIDNILEECPVCYNETNCNIKIKKCNHVFCKNCSKTWFTKHKNTCPICRTNIIEIDEEDNNMKTGYSNYTEQTEFQYQNLNDNESNESNESIESNEIDYLLVID